MRLRRLTAAVAATVCLTGLTACRSNVGLAAEINGHRISESDISKYLTPSAESVPQQNQSTGATTSIPPKSWVLRALLSTQLYSEILRSSPGGTPSESQFAAAQQTLLQGTTADAVATQYAQHGYERRFAPLYLHEQAIEQILSAEIQNGLDARSIIDRLKVHVSVNPRYGTWDATNLTLSTAAGSGVPDYLTIKPNYTPPALGDTAAPVGPAPVNPSATTN